MNNIATKNWLKEVKTAATDLTEITKTAGASRVKRLVYVLKIDQSANCKIVAYVVPIKKDGSYGKSPKIYNANNIGNGNALPQYFNFEDLAILASLYKHSEYYSTGDEYDLKYMKCEFLLEKIFATGKCHIQELNGAIITLGEEKKGQIIWDIADDGRQKCFCITNLKNDHVLNTTPVWYINPDTGICGKIKHDMPEQLLSTMLSAPSLHPLEINAVKKKLKKNLQNYDIKLPVSFTQEETKSIKPIPYLVLDTVKIVDNYSYYSGYSGYYQEIAVAYIAFQYDTQLVNPKDTNSVITSYNDNKLTKYLRNRTNEKEFTKALLKHPLVSIDHYLQNNCSANSDLQQEYYTIKIAIKSLDSTLFDDKWEEFMVSSIPTLKNAGWSVKINKDFPYNIVQADDWYSEIDEETGNDWFSFELGVKIDGKTINLLPILLQALNDKSHAINRNNDEIDDDENWYFDLADNTTLSLNAKRVGKILMFLKDIYKYKTLDSEGNLQFARYESASIAHVEELTEHLNIDWVGSKAVMDLGKKLKDFKGIEHVAVPQMLQATLREYQQEGFNWLQFLRQYGFAGILADDMGLGKTIQALAHIAQIKLSGMQNPVLVVAPTSVIHNWQIEAQKFVPDLKVLVLHGAKRQKHFESLANYDLVVTSYSLIIRDKQLLDQQFDTIILDEAQYIKNSQAKLTKVVCNLSADHKLCLTGTPIENNLNELWSQFNFLMPGFLGSKKEFTRIFKNPIEKSHDIDSQHLLINRVKPFLLRRTKDNVMQELPAKTEIIRNIDLDQNQRDLYETVRVSMHQKIQNEIANKGVGRSYISVFDALLKLRQICCDPRLLKLESAKNMISSAKLEVLMEMLPKMIKEGRKILLFSQFVGMLNLIEERINKQNIKYVKLTGQTSNRQKVIKEFQEGEIPLFLISLKAGGTGINLTAADTIIHYDPWWNPATEDQATDRAHRIGQDKPVFVYKLITNGTVEEKIVEMQKYKRNIAQGIFDPNAQLSKQLSIDDITNLFAPISQS